MILAVRANHTFNRAAHAVIVANDKANAVGHFHADRIGRIEPHRRFHMANRAACVAIKPIFQSGAPELFALCRATLFQSLLRIGAGLMRHWHQLTTRKHQHREALDRVTHRKLWRTLEQCRQMHRRALPV